jgi:hypothetical protein
MSMLNIINLQCGIVTVRIKNEQSIETDNCITTIIYILSFTVTIFMYQAQLINTEILSDKIKRNKGQIMSMLNIINLQCGIVTVRISTALVLVY